MFVDKRGVVGGWLVVVYCWVFMWIIFVDKDVLIKWLLVLLFMLESRVFLEEMSCGVCWWWWFFWLVVYCMFCGLKVDRIMILLFWWLRICLIRMYGLLLWLELGCYFLVILVSFMMVVLVLCEWCLFMWSRRMRCIFFRVVIIFWIIFKICFVVWVVILWFCLMVGGYWWLFCVVILGVCGLVLGCWKDCVIFVRCFVIFMSGCCLVGWCLIKVL